MDASGLNDQLRQVLRLRLSQKTSIFLICVAIASVFWLLNAFSKNYTTIVNLPVRYVNLPEDQVVTSELLTHLAVEVNGYGFDLLSYLTSSGKDTLVVNGKDLQRSRRDRSAAFFVTKPLFESLAGKINPAIKLNNILSDTLHFRIEERITRLVPVKANLNLNLAAQYLEDGDRIIDPPVVELSGPRSSVLGIHEVETETVQLDGVGSSINQSLALVVPLENSKLKVYPANVQVRINVDKFTDASIDLPVVVKNLPDSLSLNIIPDSVTLNYQVALGRYSEVKHQDFKLAVDFAEFNELHHKKLRILVLKQPQFVNNLSLSPEKVEFILKR